SDMTITGNGWGGVNVAMGAGVTTKPSFTLTGTNTVDSVHQDNKVRDNIYLDAVKIDDNNTWSAIYWVKDSTTHFYSWYPATPDAQAYNETTNLYYGDITHAVADGQAGDVVEMLTDVELSSALSINESITLDLGGKTITNHTETDSVWKPSPITISGQNKEIQIKNGALVSDTAKASLLIYDVEKLTLSDLRITNTKDGGYGVIVGTDNSYASTLIIDDGCDIFAHFAALSVYGYGSAVDSSTYKNYAPTIVINGGNIGSASSTYGIVGQGAYDYTNITINGGTVQALHAAIYHPQVGDLTINGGLVSGYYSGVQFSGEGAFVMNGGTVESTTEEIVELYKNEADNDGAIAESGAAILFMSRGSGYQDGNEDMTGTIHGGNIKSYANAPIIVCRMNKNGTWVFNNEDSETHPNYLDALNITGGTFTGTTDFSVEPVALEEGVVSISGGTYSVSPATDLIADFYHAEANGNLFVVTVDDTTVDNAMSDALEGLTESSETTDINDAAATVVTLPTEALVDKVDEVNALDELFVNANANLTTGTAVSASSVTTAEVSGLGLAVYGADATSIEENTYVYMDISEKTDVDLPADVEVTDATIVLEIKPMEKVGEAIATTISNTQLQTPVTFKIYLANSVVGNRATVVHIKEAGTTETHNLTILSDTTGKYVQLTVLEFSNFVVTPWTYTSSSGGNNMGTLVDTSTSTEKEEVVEEETEVETSFRDVDSDDYFYDAVLWAVEQDITTGTSATKFSPNVDATRAQVLTLIHRAYGEPVVDGDNSFDDVDSDSYYADAINWGVAQNITTGLRDGVFGTDETCTRAQIITFLWRAAGEPEVEGTQDFTDVESGSYYEPALVWAIQEGITTGTGDDTFSPENPCTRAQIVTFLYRFLG
ncbi:MAG: S-layer homology domain-containing protein, partial [Eubacteriales bacterium]